ncbi:hybrid sensor histidine kinase/response regulator [Horticoccus luteus]|uniref:histidine kinase n=1 Tax=Horticoccus luteus TaxID=2862869 RepID=A0A8F9TY96_9BACT|nr:hybrid sensor histidine kinase/response regulator [Horticoccus luteus]QYM80443.1 hybrid sensor histidine kinase/response regulator [Horticoccus luteus]
MNDPSDELKDLSLTQLFRMEAEGQLAVLTEGLLALEEKRDAAQLEALMRAAHSLKGAARIVGMDAAVGVAHAMEDCFVAAQAGSLFIGRGAVDRLLAGVDLLTRISQTSDADLDVWGAERAGEVSEVMEGLHAVLRGDVADAVPADASAEPPAAPKMAVPAVETAEPVPPRKVDAPTERGSKGETRVLRVTADHLNRLLGLAGESLVESRRLRPFGESVARLKRLQRELGGTLDTLRDQLVAGASAELLQETLAASRTRLSACREFLADRLGELDAYDRRSTNLAHRLYGEARAVRMRPFADGVAALPRVVRDLARELGKEARLEIIGDDTQVDRDVLEKLEAPLGHLLRNALDHGIERPEVRLAAGKPAAGLIKLEARHSAGVLLITISDDGRGADPEILRQAVVRRKLVAEEMAPRLSEAELLEFLFLPGFSLKEQVTEISGRGVGLDAVQSMVKSVRGSIRVATEPGRGMRFQLQLPLTLSVVRALLVQIADEPYAVPLGFIVRTMRVARDEISATEGKQHFAFEGRRVGLVSAQQMLGRSAPVAAGDLAVVVLGEGEHRYGLVVDAFMGERELVVQPLDPRLGKIKDIAAGALMEDGSPVLIVDVADLVRSVEKMAAAGQLNAVQAEAAAVAAVARKRVLVVDDSLTVRELERKLLDSRGYAVEIAVDGMDGWNAVRTGNFDLVITDVDMPRLDGVELTRLIKQDQRLRALPVMIVSYKDREDDRRRGLEAGADYYLTKGSFHDETMLNAVADLIGAATEATT